MPVFLNNDCLELVLEYCVSDTRTLYNFLTTSRFHFYQVLPLLYSRPRNWSSLSHFSRTRLEYLLSLSSGFLSEMFESQAQLPCWSNPVLLPLTVNYFSYLKTWDQEPFLLDWRWCCSRYPKWLDYQQHRILAHVQFHGRLITHFTIMITMLEQLVDKVKMFSSLKEITFHGEYDQSSSVIFSKPRQDLVQQFIKQHDEYFPGLLDFVGITHPDQNWKFLSDLQWILKRPKGLRLSTGAIIDLNSLPTEGLKWVMLAGLYPDLDQASFLSRCRRLETLSTSIWKPDCFRWARLEYEEQVLAEKMQLERRDSVGSCCHRQSFRLESMIQSSLPLPPQQQQLQPLVALRNLSLTGSTGLGLDALIGFQKTLEQLELHGSSNDCHHYLDPQMPRLAEWDFSMLRLRSLKAYHHPLELSALVRMTPNLETLSIHEDAVFPIDRHQVVHFPVSLRILNLTMNQYDLVNLKVLKDLKNLEELRLVTKGQYEKLSWPPARVYMDQKEGWWFPKLKIVLLSGAFASMCQGSFLAVAPRLESLTIQTCHGVSAPVVLDMDSFWIPVEGGCGGGDGDGYGKNRVNTDSGVHSSLLKLCLDSVSLRDNHNHDNSDNDNNSTSDSEGEQAKSQTVERLKAALSSPETMFPNLQTLSLCGLHQIEVEELEGMVDAVMTGHPRLKRLILDTHLLNRADLEMRYRRVMAEEHQERNEPKVGGCLLKFNYLLYCAV